ncbi:hypothetical protein AgCh_016838 [Apium graveolens]
MDSDELSISKLITRKKVISWTIEWRFHSTDVVLRNHGVDDNTSLSSAIMNHLKPGPFNHQLKRFCEEPLHSLNFFIRKFQHSKSPFVQLDIEAPICEQLANLVLNVNEYVKKDGTDPESVQLTRTEEKPADTLDSSSCATASEQEGTKNDIFFDKALDEQLDFSVNSTVAEIIEKLDPELVQGLLGSISSLISESSFEDLFNRDGVFMEELGLVETNDPPGSSKVLPVEEELEEGEIPQ